MTFYQRIQLLDVHHHDDSDTELRYVFIVSINKLRNSWVTDDLRSNDAHATSL